MVNQSATSGSWIRSNIHDPLKSYYRRLRFNYLAWKFRPTNGKMGLFVDCGANIGQSYSYFKSFFSPEHFAVILIEPNPNCMKILRDKFDDIESIAFIESAAWVKKDKLKFFGLVEDARGLTSAGGSIIAHHNNSRYPADVSAAIEVDTFSFSEFLAGQHQKYGCIIVKMDIESAEYRVLQDLLEKNTITYIDHLIIEFHSSYFLEPDKSQYLALEEALIRKIKSLGVGLSIWV